VIDWAAGTVDPVWVNVRDPGDTEKAVVPEPVPPVMEIGTVKGCKPLPVITHAEAVAPASWLGMTVMCNVNGTVVTLSSGTHVTALGVWDVI